MLVFEARISVAEVGELEREVTEAAEKNALLVHILIVDYKANV